MFKFAVLLIISCQAIKISDPTPIRTPNRDHVITNNMTQSTSIPACNSLGCKTDTAADSGKEYIAQRNATVTSIPACNSLGCKTDTAAPHAKKPDHPVDYPVVDNGMDKDIVDSQKH